MTGSPWMAAILAAALALPGGLARAAPGSNPGARPVRLEIDVKGLAGYQGFDPAVYEAIVRSTVTESLRERGYEVTSATAGSDMVSLALSWRDFDASSYELAYTVQRGDGPRRTMAGHLCERCDDDELAVAMRTHLDQALAGLGDEQAGTEVEPHVGPTPPGPSDDDAGPKRLAPLTAVGIGVGALGLGGVVVGAILASKHDRIEPSPEGDAHWVGTDYATPGIAVLVGGSVVLATGIALVVVGQVRHARRAGPTRVAWGPTAGRHGAGLQLMGRF